MCFLLTEYELTVITGDKNGAGTDANVFVTIYGKSGQTEKVALKNKSKNSFERNQSDTFTFKAKCVGPMTKLRVEHDNSGRGPGWYLERVSVFQSYSMHVTLYDNLVLLYFDGEFQWSIVIFVREIFTHRSGNSLY